MYDRYFKEESVAVNHNGSVFELLCSGWKEELIAPNGRIYFWKFIKLFEMGRATAVKNRNMLTDGVHHLLHGQASLLVFVIVIKYNIDFDAILEEMPDSMCITTRLLELLSSSWVMQTELTNPQTKTCFGTATFKYVLVDKQTRKSKLLPVWFKQQYRDINVQSTLKYNIPQPAPPGKMYHMKYTITEEDIDLNNHTNNSVYYRLCLQTAYEAASKGFLNSLPSEFDRYHITQSTALYVKETRLGDALKVEVFEDQGKTSAVHGQILKDDKVVFRASLTFGRPKNPVLFRSKL